MKALIKKLVRILKTLFRKRDKYAPLIDIEEKLPPEWTLVEIFFKDGKKLILKSVPNLTPTVPTNNGWIIIDIKTNVYILNWDCIEFIRFTYIKETQI